MFEILEGAQTFAIVILGLALLAVIQRKIASTSSHSGLPLPPGPPRHWLFGSSIPSAFAHRKFEEWTQEYGPVFSLKQGSNDIIIIGRLQAAIDIMEKEGSSLNDRPLLISAGETLSGGMRILLTPAGERLKKMRRALHGHLQPKIISSYAPTFMQSARQHILDILDNPEKHQEHAKQYSASVVMALTYGKVPRSYDDPDVVAVIHCFTTLGNALRPGVWKVDAYPFLQYVPGYLKELKDGHLTELTLFRNQLKTVKEKMDRQEEIPQSFGKFLLEHQQELDLSDDEIAYLAGSMFGAGSDTTASAISIGVLAAVCYPEAQAKVQAELDAVIGRDRAPTLADQEALPQMQAFILETFRWRPVAAGGFYHKATKDVIWQNYRIPKGATVIGNHWSIGRDPTVFPDPDAFNPQRWLNERGKVREELKLFPFGFGRRVCPGQYMANASVFVNTALLQWAFTMKKDPSYPIDELAFTNSITTHPIPFKVVFEPRATETWEGIRGMMEGYGQ